LPSAATIVRKIMGLPEPVAEPHQVKGEPGEQAVVPPQNEDAPPARPANPWESAGLELAKTHQQASGPIGPQSPAPAPAAPWVPHDEKSGTRALRRFGRGLLWSVVVLAAVTGVRSWIVPPKVHVPPPAPVKQADPYPAADAQATAAMFARAYLSWDDATAPARASALAMLLPAGSDTTMGWDGHGHQDVLDVLPAAVTPGDQGQARVRVLVLVRAGAAQGAPALPSRWVALEVPVAQSAGRMVVTGEPGLVGVPAEGPAAPRLTVAEADPALTGPTRLIVDQFFKSYATTGGTSAATAPGATIPPLPSGMTYNGLTSWSIDAGSGDTRTGTARVSWLVAGAAVEQTYRVSLTRVSSASAQTWQVADVHGGLL
jgi:hypothetical protein